MSKKKVKVLIVEDGRREQYIWCKKLAGEVVVVSAFSIMEAEKQFATNPDIVAIVMDACVPGDRPTTPPLVRRFRETFLGPMIAVSGRSDYQQQLLEAGCDYQSSKKDLPEKLLEVLGLFR